MHIRTGTAVLMLLRIHMIGQASFVCGRVHPSWKMVVASKHVFCRQFIRDKDMQHCWCFWVWFFSQRLAPRTIDVASRVHDDLVDDLICRWWSHIIRLWCACSTAFLVGPVQQLKNMFTLHRLAATLMYLLLMVRTNLWPRNATWGSLCCVIVQIEYRLVLFCTTCTFAEACEFCSALDVKLNRLWFALSL